jgi:hypothetical protein
MRTLGAFCCRYELAAGLWESPEGPPGTPAGEPAEPPADVPASLSFDEASAAPVELVARLVDESAATVDEVESKGALLSDPQAAADTSAAHMTDAANHLRFTTNCRPTVDHRRHSC